MPAHSLCGCLRCRTLVDTSVLLLYVLCCPVQGRLKAVLLCLGYVDNVPFGARFVPSWCAQKNKKQVQKQKLRGCLRSSEAKIMASRLDDTASFDSVSPRRAPSQQSCSPRG